MKERYEWKLINPSLNWWGFWDNVKREYLIETTSFGRKVYEEMGFVDG